MNKLIEGEDFYYNKQGYVVLTEKYHLAKGFCCGNGCMHCPYNYVNVPEAKRSSFPNPSKRAASPNPSKGGL